MSASRKFRRSVQRDAARRSLIDSLEAVRDATPAYVGPIGDASEAWSLAGQVMFIIPTIDDKWPAPVKAAVADRRVAALHGRCPTCGSERRVRRHHGRLRVELEHTERCHAADVVLAELVAEHRGLAS